MNGFSDGFGRTWNRRDYQSFAPQQANATFHQDALLAAAFGTFASKPAYQATAWRRTTMDGIIYLVGLIVIVMFILSFFGLR